MEPDNWSKLQNIRDEEHRQRVAEQRRAADELQQREDDRIDFAPESPVDDSSTSAPQPAYDVFDQPAAQAIESEEIGIDAGSSGVAVGHSTTGKIDARDESANTRLGDESGAGACSGQPSSIQGASAEPSQIAVPGLSIPRDNGHDETNTSWTRRDSIKSYSIGDDNLLQEGVTPHDFTSPTSSAPPVFRNESNAQDYSLTSDAYQPRPASSNIPQASNQESGPLFDVSPSENDTESGLEQLPQVEVGEEAKTRTGASIMGQTQIGYESEGSGTNSKRTEDISSLDQNLFPDLPSSSDEQSPRRRSRLQPHERGPAALEAHRNRSPLVPPGITPAFTFEQEPHLPEQVSAPASQPSRGHFAPVIPPGATPAPNLEQAPFLEHEPGASRTNKRVKTRPSNLDLATSGPSTATPSATNPNSVYNTPLTTGGLEAPPIPRPGNVPRSIPPMPTSAPQQFQPTFESNVVGDSVDARERSSHQPRPPPSPRIKPLEAIQRENMRPVGVQGPRDDPLNDLWPYDPDPQHAHVPPPKVSTTPPGDPPSPIPSDEEPFLGGGDCDEQQQQQQQPTGQQQTGQQQQPAAQSARASRPKRSKRVAGKIKDGAWKVGKPVALVGKAVWKFLRHGMERSPPAAVGGLYGPLTDLSNGDLFKRSK